MASNMKNTGERLIKDDYLSTLSGYVIYLIHAASYTFAETYCKGKRVLDFGCGTGYGSAKISESATNVFAVDISPDAIEYARNLYSSLNIKFETISPNALLPLPDNSIDIVISFQVIEHVFDTTAYLAEAARVLTVDGLLLLITPDRRSRLLQHQKPWNRWHIKEYDPASLQHLIEPNFDVREILAMGATPEVYRIEDKRYQLLKWATLPFTFPGSPEPWRIFGLTLLNRLSALLKSGPAKPFEPKFGIEKIIIKPRVDQPLNIIIAATPKKIFPRTSDHIDPIQHALR